MSAAAFARITAARIPSVVAHEWRFLMPLAIWRPLPLPRLLHPIERLPHAVNDSEGGRRHDDAATQGPLSPAAVGDLIHPTLAKTNVEVKAKLEREGTPIRMNLQERASRGSNFQRSVPFHGTNGFGLVAVLDGQALGRSRLGRRPKTKTKTRRSRTTSDGPKCRRPLRCSSVGAAVDVRVVVATPASATWRSTRRREADQGASLGSAPAASLGTLHSRLSLVMSAAL